MKKKKISISSIILGIVFFTGVCLLLYPTVSDIWNSYRQSLLIAAYTDQVEEMDEEDYEDLFAAAEAYNESLVGTTIPHEMSDEESVLYNSLLNVTDTGIMGYIEIPKIDVKLPIYHTVDEEVLQEGAGHMEGTSLPVGGDNTHSVICGHRGLPYSKLFTDLDRMEVGDTFMIHVLNETFTYEVDQILVVLPDDSSALGIEEGMDLVTLFTCTPYGINTHRLLVRGHRIPNTEDSVVTADATIISKIKVSFVLGILMIIIMIVVMAVARRRRKKEIKDR